VSLLEQYTTRSHITQPADQLFREGIFNIKFHGGLPGHNLQNNLSRTRDVSFWNINLHKNINNCFRGRHFLISFVENRYILNCSQVRAWNLRPSS